MEKTGKSPNQKNRRFTRGLVFGTFDPLHFGHIRLLRRASKLCDELCVVTESDNIIRSEKHREPFASLPNRMLDLLGIKYVNHIGFRTEKMDRKYWANDFNADVLIVGDDHKESWKEGETLGLPIIYLPYTREISSTEIRSSS